MPWIRGVKVLQVSKFYPPVMGGIETVTWELAEGLHKAGLHTSVLCSHQEPRGRRDRAPAGYEVWRAGRWGTVLSTSIAPTMPLLLSRLAATAHVVHVHMPDPMAAAALRCTSVPGKVVVHWHSDVVRQRRAMKLYEPLQRWLLQRADAIVVTSPPYAESSAPLLPWKQKIQVIPIGITDNRDATSIENAARLREKYGSRRFVFSLGRMTYYKGFDVLIDAAAQLPDDCVVVVGGDGELLAELRGRVRGLGLQGKIDFVGKIPDHELMDYFSACDVFCMCSTVRAEAYGVAMLEAMVMGKPIVATEIEGSGVPWVNRHGDTGINVPARDSGALARALQTLLDDPTLRLRLGQASRKRYEREFGARLMTERTLHLYRRVLPVPATHQKTSLGTQYHRPLGI